MTRPRSKAALAGEDGFTLVEVLVTTIAGVVLMLATLSLLDISTRQAARATDRVEATQRGRTAMEELVQELHSSCVWAAASPVQAQSDGSDLRFITQFSSSAVVSPSLHVVSLAGGNLTDTAYAATGGTAPSWTFAQTATSTKTLASNVSTVNVNGVTQPLFQYYQYVNGQLSWSSPLSTPLSPTDAGNTTAVTISFAAGPSDTSTEKDRAINLNDSVVLAPPPTGTPQCQ
jgi:Tfp pilus assembly protein PilV